MSKLGDARHLRHKPKVSLASHFSLAESDAMEKQWEATESNGEPWKSHRNAIET